MAGIAVVSLGSRGDLYPLLGIGRALRDRNHDVTVFEHTEYEDEIVRTGMRFAALGSGSACQEVFEHTSDASQALAQLIRRVALPNALQSVDRIVSGGPYDAIVAHHFQYAGQLAAELLGIPLVSVSGADIAELCFPSRRLPPAQRAAAARTLTMVDRLGTPRLNAVRRRLGLAERPYASTVGSLSDTAVVITCSRLFLPDTTSWPEHFHVAGYPDYTGGDQLEVPSDVEEFVERTDLGPLVVCTLGDSWANDYPETCRNLGRLADRRGFRVLFLVCRGRVDAEGERCLVRSFVPLAPVLSRARAIVHHAGRGSLMTGLRAGIPALMIPHWLDGFENARRAAELGLGRVVAPGLGIEEVDREVTALLTDDDSLRRARAAAAVIAQDPDPGTVAERCVLSAAVAGAS